MITYNHSKFIEQTIESIMNQTTNFDYKLFIGEDFSSDDTRAICKRLKYKYPDKIDLFLNDTNLGANVNARQIFKACFESGAKYVALCEGDDYWIDPLKLQKQVDFLEDNKDYVLCFHPIKILKQDGEIVDDFITNVPQDYETIETLARLGNYIHTPSVVFRNVIKELPFEFQLTPIGDYFLYIILAQYGKLKCLEEKMAVYRYNVGVISKMSNLDIANNNVKMYSCMIGYIKNENVKKIIIEKQIKVVTGHYKMIKATYDDAFISRHFIFLKIKKIAFFSKNPKLFWKRVKKKFQF
ncbi:glycosyltransferase [Flavobacterium potami]|nr:glycosyltransferase [Flavobacterium potami]